MSLKIMPIQEIPQQTVEAVRAAFPKGHREVKRISRFAKLAVST